MEDRDRSSVLPIIERVGDDVGQANHRFLVGAGNATRAADREAAEADHGFVDPINDPGGGKRIDLGDEPHDLGEVAPCGG